MKKNIKIISVGLVATVLVLFACKKTYTIVAQFQVADQNMAYLKIVHASPNFRALTGKQDTFNVYVSGARVNSPFFTFNSIFPGTGSNTYIAVQPGQQELKLSIPGVVNPDSVKIVSFTKNFVAGKAYTWMITDSLSASRDSSQIFVQDNFATPTPGYINLRFIHAVLNDTAGKTVDLWSYARNSAVLTKIKPDSVSSFQLLGFNPGVADTFYVRRTGTTNVLAKLLFAANNQRSYTLYFRGDANVATGAKAKTLLAYTNQ